MYNKLTIAIAVVRHFAIRKV